MAAYGSRLLTPVDPAWEWQLHAACRTVDPELFFHPDGARGTHRAAQERAALEVCASCPVVAPCRRHSLRVPEQYGVWGGLSEDDRARIHARAPGDAPPPRDGPAAPRPPFPPPSGLPARAVTGSGRLSAPAPAKEPADDRPAAGATVAHRPPRPAPVDAVSGSGAGRSVRVVRCDGLVFSVSDPHRDLAAGQPAATGGDRFPSGDRPPEPGTRVHPWVEQLEGRLARLDVGTLLSELAGWAADRIGGGVGCVLSLDRGGGVVVVAATDASASVLAETLYADGGPATATASTGRAGPPLDPVSRIVTHPGGSSVSLPLTVGTATAGFLTIHTPNAGAFAAAHPFAVAAAVADAAGALAVLRQLAIPARLDGQLQTAFAARAVIDQAVGVIVHDRRCTPGQAWEFLRGASHRRGTAVGEVAAALVARATRPLEPTSDTAGPQK